MKRHAIPSRTLSAQELSELQEACNDGAIQGGCHDEQTRKDIVAVTLQSYFASTADIKYPKGYCFITAKRRSYKWLRANSRTISIDTLNEKYWDHVFSPPSIAADDYETTELTGLALRLVSEVRDHVYDKLNEDDRMLLDFYFLDRRNFKQASSLLGWSYEGTKKRWERLILKLGKHIAQTFSSLPEDLQETFPHLPCLSKKSNKNMTLGLLEAFRQVGEEYESQEQLTQRFDRFYHTQKSHKQVSCTNIESCPKGTPLLAIPDRYFQGRSIVHNYFNTELENGIYISENGNPFCCKHCWVNFCED